MIVILHKHNKFVKVYDNITKKAISISDNGLVNVFFELARRFKNRLIVWCDDDLRDYINAEEFNQVFYHKLVMASFEVGDTNYIDDRIGYVESSPFIKINKSVNYPTWIMGSSIGGINSDVLACYNVKDYKNRTFDYTLNSIAKLGIVNGLFCYSSPKLLRENIKHSNNDKSSKYEMFKFIKEHYRGRWTYIAFFNSLVYEKRFLLLPLIMSFFTSKKINKPSFKELKTSVNNNFNSNVTLDVIIPTIGRKEFLYNVLKDLSHQTLLPKSVIIIEQNSDHASKTTLDYLQNESWPFHIKHSFINKTGACNARNMALKQTESDWIFLADDDIRFKEKTFEIALKEIYSYGLNAATLACLRRGDKEIKQPILQWNTFGSGCSIISNRIAKLIAFDIAFEHGFGEDGDFGMQIRNLGEDIAYLPKCKLLHLKASTGGFRTNFIPPWKDHEIQPKPLPTIMLYNLKHQSCFQINGYKTILFLKYFKLQDNRNIVSYFFQMKKQWQKSVYLAKQLKIQSN